MKGWYGNRQGHSLASRGISTKSINKDDVHEKNIGINYQSDYNENEVDIIEYLVSERVADMVEEGYSRGQLFSEEPDFNGWFEVHIEKDDSDEDIRNEEVARLIREGYTSGYYPTWSYRANVWRDD